MQSEQALRQTPLRVFLVLLFARFSPPIWANRLKKAIVSASECGVVLGKGKSSDAELCKEAQLSLWAVRRGHVAVYTLAKFRV